MLDLSDVCTVTKEYLHRVIESNVPFLITMADGKEYTVPHRDFIAFTRKGTAVVVTTEDDRIHILPLITMTGISLVAPVSGN